MRSFHIFVSFFYLLFVLLRLLILFFYLLCICFRSKFSARLSLSLLSLLALLALLTLRCLLVLLSNFLSICSSSCLFRVFGHKYHLRKNYLFHFLFNYAMWTKRK